MSITYGFFNSLAGDRKYNADQISRYFDGLVTDGVYETIGGALQVRASTGMTLQIQTGRAILDCKWLQNDAIHEITLNPSHMMLDRYTAIVIRLSYDTREIDIVAKDGGNASVPEKPQITSDNAIKELCLAYIHVKKGVNEIVQANIIDMRPSGLCGWVTGLIKQVDTSQLYAQWQDAYQRYYNEQKLSFEQWFLGIKDVLEDTENGKLLSEIYELVQLIYQKATNEDIDNILNNTYVEKEDIPTVFATATNEDIDSIINGNYTEQNETEDQITNKNIDTIVQSMFN